MSRGLTPPAGGSSPRDCGHLVHGGNFVNTSVTSVDTSADCASGRGMLASTDTLEEPQLLCRKKPLRLVYQGRGAIEHQGFLRGERDQGALG
jgi:hypothetical protein